MDAFAYSKNFKAERQFSLIEEVIVIISQAD